MDFSKPDVYWPYITFAVFLITAVVVVGREFLTARGIDKAYPLGRVAIAVPIAVFGTEHFASALDIMKMVPRYMPGRLFWTYFVGVCLFAAAVSFIFRIWIPLAASLLGIMFACFVAMMDLPGSIVSPHSRFNWTLAARELVFSAGALLLAVTSGSRKRTRGENVVAMVALSIVACVSIFYGIEQILQTECVPAVPLQKVTPLWIPLAHFWTLLTGIIMIIGGAAMFVPSVSRQSAAALGFWVVLLVLTLYLAIMIAKPNLEGLNYFTDTLMFGGVLLVAARGYQRR